MLPAADDERLEARLRALSRRVSDLEEAMELAKTKMELMQGRLDFYQQMFEVTRTRRRNGDH